MNPPNNGRYFNTSSPLPDNDSPIAPPTYAKFRPKDTMWSVGVIVIIFGVLSSILSLGLIFNNKTDLGPLYLGLSIGTILSGVIVLSFGNIQRNIEIMRHNSVLALQELQSINQKLSSGTTPSENNTSSDNNIPNNTTQQKPHKVSYYSSSYPY